MHEEKLILSPLFSLILKGPLFTAKDKHESERETRAKRRIIKWTEGEGLWSRAEVSRVVARETLCCRTASL